MKPQSDLFPGPVDVEGYAPPLTRPPPPPEAPKTAVLDGCFAALDALRADIRVLTLKARGLHHGATSEEDASDG